MKYQARAYFGLPADPWAGRHRQTPDAQRAQIMVDAAVHAQGFVRVVGARGAGKSHAVRRALARAGSAKVVEPMRLDRERLHLGDIQTAIVRDLSDERPRLSGEARTGQVRRILGAMAARPPVLLIDDAHTLHAATLKGLKRLRELSYRGVSPLIGIVLVGQTDPAASVPEVALRSDLAPFAGLTSGDVRASVAAAINAGGERIEAAAIGAIEASDRSLNWLNLQSLVDECLAHAAARGAERVTAAHVRSVLSPAAEPAAVPTAKAKRSGDVDKLLDTASQRASTAA